MRDGFKLHLGVTLQELHIFLTILNLRVEKQSCHIIIVLEISNKTTLTLFSLGSLNKKIKFLQHVRCLLHLIIPISATKSSTTRKKDIFAQQCSFYEPTKININLSEKN